MQSEQHILRLVRELDLPEQADQVIQRSKYWTPDFCWLYFDRCDELIFDDAQAGLQATEVGPELVALVSRFNRDQSSQGRLGVRALAVLGSAYRAVGELEQAEETYRAAFHLMRTKAVPETAGANLFFRVAILYSVQDRLDAALRLSDASVRIYRRSNDDVKKKHLGEALTIRGICYFQARSFASAMKDWSEALSCTDPRKRSRIYHSASHNLACGLVSRAIDSRSLATIEDYLVQARRFLSKRPRSLQKLRVIWLQGLIMNRFGSTRRGEAALRTARRGFIEMKAPLDMALVSVTLGQYLYRNHRSSELRALARETETLFWTMCSDTNARRAVRLWKQSLQARTVSAQAFTAAWKVIQQRAAETSVEKISSAGLEGPFVFSH